MRHEWIFEVLSDLRAYALRNRLPLLAERTEDLLALARSEIGDGAVRDDETGGGSDGAPPRGVSH